MIIIDEASEVPPEMWNDKIDEPCCNSWEKAHEAGTDNELYGALVYNCRQIGASDRLPPVNFCPWCAAPKVKQ